MCSSEDKELILEMVDFRPLRDARILITGGSGFIGSWMSIRPAWLRMTALNQLQYDYGDWDKQSWDAIIHLAPPLPRRVIECADRCDAKILYASSGAVYDRQPGEYATGKRMGENQLIEWGGRFGIARMFTFCGAWMRNHFAVTNYICDAFAGGPIKIRGDNVTRSYMYAADMAVWLWRILLHSENGIYNVGGSNPVTMYELAHEVRRHFRQPDIVYDRIYGPDARPNYIPQGLEKTCAELDVEEYNDFSSAISKTVDWYKRHLHA